MNDPKREEIKVIVRKDGTFEYEVRGVKGTSCKELTKFLDNLGDASEICKTDEWHEEAESSLEIEL